MKTVNLIPYGWPCSLLELERGLFYFSGTIGFKSEYGTNDPVNMAVFCAQTGEIFWGGVKSHAERANLIVQPIIIEKGET